MSVSSADSCLYKAQTNCGMGGVGVAEYAWVVDEACKCIGSGPDPCEPSWYCN